MTTSPGHGTRVAALLDPKPAPGAADVVVIGAGIAGLAFGLALAKLGHRDIVIVERGYPGAGATGRNVARIRAMQLSEALCDVAGRCQETYDRMGDELGFNILFYRMGYAWILYEPDEVGRMRDIVAMHHRVGVHSQWLDEQGALDAVPVLRGGDPVAAAVVHDDAIVHHDAVVWAHLERLATTGVTMLPDTAVTGILRGDEGVRGVETTRGTIATRHVVNATDGWSTEVNQLAGVDAPNRPYRREVLVTAPIERAIDKAVTFYRPTEGWFNQTLRGEVVMGVVDPAEPSRVDQRSSWAFLRRTAELITRKAPALRDLSVIRQWGGMYDVSPDHLPLVGPTGQLDGWWQANAWSGRGMLLAPYLVGLLAERFATGSVHQHLAMFDPDRFVPGGRVETEADYYARYAGSPSSRP